MSLSTNTRCEKQPCTTPTASPTASRSMSTSRWSPSVQSNRLRHKALSTVLIVAARRTPLLHAGPPSSASTPISTKRGPSRWPHSLSRGSGEVGKRPSLQLGSTNDGSKATMASPSSPFFHLRTCDRTTPLSSPLFRTCDRTTLFPSSPRLRTPPPPTTTI